MVLVFEDLVFEDNHQSLVANVQLCERQAYSSKGLYFVLVGALNHSFDQNCQQFLIGIVEVAADLEHCNDVIFIQLLPHTHVEASCLVIEFLVEVV